MSMSSVTTKVWYVCTVFRHHVSLPTAPEAGWHRRARRLITAAILRTIGTERLLQ